MQTWPSPGFGKMLFPVAQPDISDFDIQAVERDLSSGNVSGGSPTIQKAEEALATILKADCLVVSNGSVALILALKALGIEAGDEVIVPNLTYAATASSVIHVGAKPVFCDSDSDDWNISLESAKESLSRKTKAIILVDLYGVTRDWSPVVAWARASGLSVIHDCAESLTSSWDGQPTGVQADIRTYSFFANKLLTCGEGGAVATQNPSLLNKMRVLRGQGMSEAVRYWFDIPGFNFRMSSMQAALLTAQTTRIREISARRDELFSRYDRIFGPYASRPISGPQGYNSPWMYTVSLQGVVPRSLAAVLAGRGVETRPVFYPLDSMPAFSSYRSDRPSPNAQRINEWGLSLPTWNTWSESDLTLLESVIKDGLHATAEE
jgi:perosamine synthetase